jgi:predicted enzyme related to lactoylglutathione lyase
MEMKRHVVGWFEIPVKDMDRAVRFYEEVFQLSLSRHNFGTLDMAWFPGAEGDDLPGSPGSLVYHEEFYKPSSDGILIYFTGFSGDLNNELSRVEKAGGKVTGPKRMISPEIGYMGVFIDTEGNRIAIHTRN